jgi:hypothetical protein
MIRQSSQAMPLDNLLVGNFSDCKDFTLTEGSKDTISGTELFNISFAIRSHDFRSCYKTSMIARFNWLLDPAQRPLRVPGVCLELGDRRLAVVTVKPYHTFGQRGGSF